MNDTVITNHKNEAANDLHSLQTYVSDLLALEEHIAKPLDAQLDSEAIAAYPQAAQIVREVKARNHEHVQALKDCLDDLGGHAASPLKSAWASLLGGAAGAIGGSRKTKVTKWLRDDYTALNLAAMSYTLLHATAVGLDDAKLADLARDGLTDYARSVMQINQAVPQIVLSELREDGSSVATGAAELVRQQNDSIWREAGNSLRIT